MTAQPTLPTKRLSYPKLLIHFSRRAFTAMSVITLLAVGEPALATDHFLTIGGGVSADKTQVSIEQNVIYLQKVLTDFAVPSDCQDVLFSDGNADGPDVQYYDPDSQVPKVNRLLAQVFNRERGLDSQYRSQRIPGVRGASTRKELTNWFDTIGAKLPDGDRLFIYYTAHGGGGKPARNTTLQLWGEDSMSVKEFSGLLDRVPPKVRVVLIMVQCHSGGFADVIFENGESSSDASKLSAFDRCGFFATVHERPAAGCTPDINEENYREYSTYFWAALSGKNRAGSKVTECDYDGNGHVSLAEAHAYVQLTSDTIHIPVSTSDALLRVFGKTSASDKLRPDSPFDDLLSAASAPERAVLAGLSEQLKLSGPSRVKDARAMADAIARERKELERKENAASAEAARECDKIRSALMARWPVLANPYHPAAIKLLGADAGQLVTAIESHPSYRTFEERRQTAYGCQQQSLELERKWVKTQRLVRVAEDVALAASFEKVAPKEAVERYRKLLEAEGGTLERREE